MTGLAVLLTAWLATAADDGDPLGAHLAAAERAMRAEGRVDLEGAWASCSAALAALPEGPRSPQCRERLAFLDVRRDADGSWAGWAALETLRRAYRHLDPAEARGRVVALLALEGVGPMVEAEATLWLALDSLDRLDDAQGALELTSAAWPDRHTLDEHVRQRLVLTRARALATLGRHDEARTVEAEVRIAGAGTRRTPSEALARAQLEARLGQISWLTVGAFLLVSAPLALRRRARWPVPLGLLPLLASAGAAWVLAERWAEGAGAALPLMGLSLAGVHLVALAARTTPAPAPWRALVSLAAALASLAVTWLALARTGTVGWVWR